VLQHLIFPATDVPPVSYNFLYCFDKDDIIFSGTVEATTLLGHVGVSICDEAHVASLITNSILGGDTLSSRLGNHIRDNLGLSYGVYSRFEAGVHAGSFVIRMQSKTEHMAEVVQAAWQVVHQLVEEGVTEEEVKIAKYNLISRQTLDLSAADNLGRALSTAYLCGKPDWLTAPLHLPNDIIHVSVAKVNEILRKYIDPWRLARVTVGPAKVNLGPWKPSRTALPPIVEPVRVAPERPVCYEQGHETRYSAKSLFFNTYGVKNGRISGTFSWNPPEQAIEVSEFKLWWATSCSRTDIIAIAGPVWLDVLADPSPQHKYTVVIEGLLVPVGATTILLLSLDSHGMPWPGGVGVSVGGN
jgi:hypothetical protein